MNLWTRERLDDILQETEELIKIFVTSIKTAEKKQKWRTILKL